MTAVIDLGWGLWPPLNPNGTVTAFTLDETGTDKIETIFRAQRAITISRLHYSCASVAGSPTIKLSLQGVNTGTGRADGTIKGATNSCHGTSGTLSANTAGWVNTGETYTCTRGELLAWVAELASGTSAGINHRYNDSVTRAFPYSLTFNNTGSVVARSTNVPIFGYGSSSVAYGFPHKANRGTTWSTANQEYGNVFTLPAWFSTVKLAGVKLWARNNTTSSFDLLMYQGSGASDTTATNTVSVAAIDTNLSTTGSYVVYDIPFTDSSMTALSASSSFRLSIKVASGTVGIFGFDVNALADFEAMSPWGQSAFSTTRTAGSWTDTNSTLYGIWPYFEDITAPSGGAGLAMPVTGRICAP